MGRGQTILLYMLVHSFVLLLKRKLQEDTQMASEHTKRCSTSVVIRETRIKITMRHHTHPHGCYQKRKNEKFWWGCREIGTLMHCWWQRQWHRFRGTIWWFLKMSNIELPHNPPIPRLGIHPKEVRADSNTHCTPVFIAALHTTAKRSKQSKCP